MFDASWKNAKTNASEQYIRSLFFKSTKLTLFNEMRRDQNLKTVLGEEKYTQIRNVRTI